VIRHVRAHETCEEDNKGAHYSNIIVAGKSRAKATRGFSTIFVIMRRGGTFSASALPSIVSSADGVEGGPSIVSMSAMVVLRNVRENHKSIFQKDGPTLFLKILAYQVDHARSSVGIASDPKTRSSSQQGELERRSFPGDILRHLRRRASKIKGSRRKGARYSKKRSRVVLVPHPAQRTTSSLAHLGCSWDQQCCRASVSFLYSFFHWLFTQQIQQPPS